MKWCKVDLGVNIILTFMRSKFSEKLKFIFDLYKIKIMNMHCMASLITGCIHANSRSQFLFLISPKSQVAIIYTKHTPRDVYNKTIFRKYYKVLALLTRSAIIIIIMNFYSPLSNTRCHSIGLKMRIARIKIRVDSQGRWERA